MLEVYDFAEDWMLLIEELEEMTDELNYCNEKSDCSYKRLDACNIPVVAFNKNADLTEFNRQFGEYKGKLPFCEYGIEKIGVDSVDCEANKCITRYSWQ